MFPGRMDETFVDDLVDGSASWILCGFLRRLMAIVGCMCADALLCRDQSVDSGSLLICSCVWRSVQPGDCVCCSCSGSRHCVVCTLCPSLDKSAAGANDDENF